MWQALPRIKSKVISFLVFVAILAVPLLLPGFAGHRSAWLLFVIVLAVIAWLFNDAMTLVHQRMVALSGNRIGSHPIARNTLGLIASLLVLVVTFHYAALPSDTIFILVAIPGLVAVWLALRCWRALFEDIAEKLRLGARTCGAIALLILCIGFGLHFFLDRHNATIAIMICFLAALGCSLATPPFKSLKS
jgi:hypothetical protein